MSALMSALISRSRYLAVLAAALIGLGLNLTHAAGLPSAAAATPSEMLGLGLSADWQELTPNQKRVLMPLASRWARIDDVSRAKWINVADRFDKLTPAEKQRVQERMAQWAKLPPEERGEARLRFEQARQLSARERQQKWAAYQALSAEVRADLAHQAKRLARPVFLANNMVGPREAKQAYSTKRQSQASAADRKSNVVPSVPAPGAPSLTLVGPTTVKASAGATTNLLGLHPIQPPHQQSGLPKIAATKVFVDPVTLLPKKGAQSAAMASLPDAAGSQLPH